MKDSPTSEMILVYDLRRDKQWRERILSGKDDQWESYKRGELPAQITEGRITELFYAPYEGEHMFALDAGTARSSWARQGDASWYVVGRRAKVERVVFRGSICDVPVVTRIWIGDNA